jgi:flagellar basal-body rod protein FlgB
MDFGKIPLFKAIGERLGFLEARQNVLSDNIANVDTPGFKPKDLKTESFGNLTEAALQKLQPAVTDPHHILPASASTGSAAYPLETKGGNSEETVNGNSVNLEDQLLKISETSFDHQTVLNLYHKQIGLLKTALDRGGS